MQVEMPPEVVSWKVVLVAMVAWLVSLAIAVVDLYLLREVLLDALTWLGYQMDLRRSGPSLGMPFGYTVAVVDRFYVLFFACAGVVLAVLIERYYRGGGGWKSLLRRVSKVLAIEAAAAALFLALRWLI
jgi:hypothetical protein